jgi:hypothetical protein
MVRGSPRRLFHPVRGDPHRLLHSFPISNTTVIIRIILGSPALPKFMKYIQFFVIFFNL